MTTALTGRDIKMGHDNDRIGTALVLDTGEMRIWHLRLRPGETLPAHRHDRPYFWTALNNGKGRSRYADGRSLDVTYRTGDTRHFDDLSPENRFVHDLTNTGENELLFVTVEFRTQQGHKK